MNIFHHFTERVKNAAEAVVKKHDSSADIGLDRILVEPPREASHGDLATNVAMVLAKPLGLKPRDLATRIAVTLAEDPDIDAAEVAGPGFINLRLRPAYWHGVLRGMIETGATYGRSDIGAGRKVNVEYVSANPTGPMHVGHTRGAVFGDALASLLAFAGFEVTREYYINDAGAQVDVLARSAYLRYREALGEQIVKIPEGLYPGDYLKPVGATLARRFGQALLTQPESAWLPAVREVTVAAMMTLIRSDLAELGIRQDVFFSEHSTEFGDDVDRPLKKSDGSYTYFASDIAYHYDKFLRGFQDMIDVWGADHGGYVRRMQAAVKAITGGDGSIDLLICQLVRLLRAGEPVKMSKRSGEFVTLRDVVEEVGRDPIRFMMIFRKNDAPLDFDFEKVTEQSKDNPVFYVQYAHARTCSVFRQAGHEMAGLASDENALARAALDRLTDSGEMALIRRLAEYPRVVEAAAAAHEPHRVAFYLYDLASEFHGHWNRGKELPQLRFISPANPDVTLARLALIHATKLVLSSGLSMLGVSAPEEMR